MTTLGSTAPPQPQPPPPVNDARLALEINSCRIIAVADQLAMCAQSSEQPDRFNALCLSLARGIDYGLAQNVVPAHTSKLPPVLNMVGRHKNEMYLQPAIMVLMISVKNACKLNWFSPQDTEELLALVDEVASNFVTRKDFNVEVFTILPTVSTIMSRYYPQYKLGNVLASLEVKPGFGAHLIDFHVTKDIVIAKEEKIYLFVAMKDNVDTASCIVTPQEVNIMLNGNAVERRSRAFMDTGPQLPTAVNRYLKYGVNLLQVLGQFNGDYIFIICLMSYTSSSGLPVPQDYEQPNSAAICLDSELIEGPSLVSLNCPISKTRIKTPVKGHLCKHYQCFDFNTYVEMNFRRPSWRCPSCNKSVSFTDLRVDRKMAKALQDVGEKECEVIISMDGSFKPASSNKHKDESHDMALASQLGGHELDESPTALDGPCNMFDLTGEDDMDTTDLHEPVDTKPVVLPNVQAPPLPSNMALPPYPGSTTALINCSSAHVSNNQSPRPVINNTFPAGLNSRPQARVSGMSVPLTGDHGMMVPVSTDAVSSALSRQPDNSQGALIVQPPVTSPHMSNASSQQHSRPSMSIPTASGSSASLQSLQQGIRLSTPTHNTYMPHTLSQPPHMRTSPLPRNQNQHGVGPRAVASNCSTGTHPSHLQRVQLTGSQASHMRPPHTMALQSQAAIRMHTSSSALSSGGSVAPQAVSRPENLINIQSEQHWRPTNRMRGALSGEQYMQALSQLKQGAAPAQTPRPRPSVPLPGVSTPGIEVLLANRRISSELQDQSLNGRRVEGSQGVNNSTKSFN